MRGLPQARPETWPRDHHLLASCSLAGPGLLGSAADLRNTTRYPQKPWLSRQFENLPWRSWP